ncbi:MAG: ECF subfamily RNA polymerase sigma-24 subunit [Parcubacteria group bacterium GW2011_GWB1_43_8]|nr:MAG: ECF subfamily RNA polymerase sigma-24 subunit [Parcubacteria group bacterium GW2011_GWB1_43_8]
MKAREIAGQDIKNLPDEEVLAISLVSPSAFEILVDRYQSAFLRKAGIIVKMEEDAQDTVQETFVKIYLNAKKFRKEKAGDSFKNWAYKILINCAISRYGKLKKEMLASSPLDTGDSGEKVFNLSADYAERENLETKIDNKNFVSVILEKLPDAFSAILKKYFFGGKSHKEIAAEDGISVVAAKLRLFRAKKAFKKAAEEMGKMPLMI